MCTGVRDVSLSTDGRSLVNNSIIFHEEFEVGDKIICSTTNTTGCCGLHDFLTPGAQIGSAPSGVGSWLHPNGSYVRLVLTTDVFVITRGPGVVRLRRNRQGPRSSGLWTCLVPDSMGRQQTLNVWFYFQRIPEEGIL